MEKRKPTYDLGSFQDAARRGDVAVTKTAAQAAQRLGFDYNGMMSVVESMERRHFYKSMTAYADSTAWQDVYHVPSSAGTLYVKFMAGRISAFDLLSFKEK
jgi:motility quorum-sensing regulator/GCU-specific mRNA interferase toxin